MTIAALYVETVGVYYGLLGVDPWDETRDPQRDPAAIPRSSAFDSSKGHAMTNHQNRSSRAGPASNPTPAAIRAMRERADLTPADAAALIHASTRAWQQWETGDRRMHPAMWELFRIKIG